MGPAFARQSAKREEGTGERDWLRETEVDRCTTVIQIAFISVLQSEMSLFVNVCYKIIMVSEVMGLSFRPKGNIFVS